MKTIEFFGFWGDQKKKVHICMPTGGEGIQIIVDDFYHGIILKRAGRWVGYLNANSELTADDISILGDIIAEGDLFLSGHANTVNHIGYQNGPG